MAFISVRHEDNSHQNWELGPYDFRYFYLNVGYLRAWNTVPALKDPYLTPLQAAWTPRPRRRRNPARCLRAPLSPALPGAGSQEVGHGHAQGLPGARDRKRPFQLEPSRGREQDRKQPVGEAEALLIGVLRPVARGRVWALVRARAGSLAVGQDLQVASAGVEGSCLHTFPSAFGTT
ncbi:uncharacterized protein LOC103787774 [Callithrix jacchus]